MWDGRIPRQVEASHGSDDGVVLSVNYTTLFPHSSRFVMHEMNLFSSDAWYFVSSFGSRECAELGGVVPFIPLGRERMLRTFA